jgi:cytochrome P450
MLDRHDSTELASLSLMDPEVQSSPYELYALLQDQQPVYKIPENGMYVITRYEDVRAVLMDTATFSSDFDFVQQMLGERDVHYNGVIAERGWEYVAALQRSDPPVHGRHRKILEKVFDLKHVKALAPRITDVANELISAFIDRGECDFINEFALPLPGTIISEQLGLDRGQLATFKQWSTAIKAPLAGPRSDAELRASAQLVLDMQHFLKDVFEERRQRPREDFISTLVHTRIEGEEMLSMHEMQGIMRQLISGGYDTVTNALCNGLWLLLRFPAQLAKLRTSPELVNGFIDEALRFESPVQGLLRQTTRDVEFAGTLIPKGATVITRYGAANRDPAKFSCPHQFDIERKNSASNLAFGMGIHFCVGRALARSELAIAFSRLLERLKDIRLAQPLPYPVHTPSLMFHPMKELKIKFEPA